MSEVRTRDEAITAVDQALSAWLSTVTGVLQIAQSVGRAAGQQAQDELGDRRNRISAIQALMASADQDGHRRLEAELRRVADAHVVAQRAVNDAQRIQDRLSQLARAQTREATTRVNAARADLSRMTLALQGYRSGTASGAGAGPASANSAGPAVDGLSQLGLTELDVSAADLDSNPILDGAPGAAAFGKGGLTRADFRWAVQTWNDTVGPGIARGKTRDDFAARDAASSAPPLRRTADVYDLFVASDRIRVNRRPDGTLDITGGRHRLQIAKELGIKTLPGEVF